jgi:hypothetical protein
MTSDAVLMYRFRPLLFYKYNLWLISQGENGSMPHAVFCFEKVMIKYIVVGDMAIVAIGPLAV